MKLMSATLCQHWQWDWSEMLPRVSFETGESGTEDGAVASCVTLLLYIKNIFI